MRHLHAKLCTAAALFALVSAPALNGQQLSTAAADPLALAGLESPALSARQLPLKPIGEAANRTSFIANPPQFEVRRTYRRSNSVIAMYIVYGLLQGLDTDSTIRGIRDHSAVEANPILSPFASHPAAFVTVKSALTVGTIYAVDRLHKYHPRFATSLLASINAGYAAVVVHNYKDSPPK